MNDTLLTTLRGLLRVIVQAAETAIQLIDAERAASPELADALSKIRGGRSDLPPMLGRDNVGPPPSQET